MTQLLHALHHEPIDAALFLGVIGATLTTLAVLWSRP